MMLELIKGDEKLAEIKAKNETLALNYFRGRFGIKGHLVKLLKNGNFKIKANS